MSPLPPSGPSAARSQSHSHFVPPSPLSSFSPRAALSSYASSPSSSSSLDGSPPHLRGPTYVSSPAHIRARTGRWQATPAPPFTRSPLALVVPSTLPNARRHPPVSRRYLVKAGRKEARGVQSSPLPPQFAHDVDVGRRGRVFEELVAGTVERRLRDKAGRVEGVGLEGRRELGLLAAVNSCNSTRRQGELFRLSHKCVGYDADSSMYAIQPSCGQSRPCP